MNMPILLVLIKVVEKPQQRQTETNDDNAPVTLHPPLNKGDGGDCMVRTLICVKIQAVEKPVPPRKKVFSGYITSISLPMNKD